MLIRLIIIFIYFTLLTFLCARIVVSSSQLTLRADVYKIGNYRGISTAMSSR